MNTRLRAIQSILVALRGHLVRSANVVGTYGTDISPSGAFILRELSDDPSLNIPKLADLLGVNRSSISRSIASLIHDKLIAVDLNAKDKMPGQRKKFVLTAEGERYLKKRDAFTREKIFELSASFSKVELKHFTRYLTIFSQLSPQSQRDVDPYELIMVSFRELTKLHGIPQENFVETGESAGTWVILSDIYYNHLYMNALAERYRVEHVQLSQVIRRLQSRGLVTLSEDAADGRMKELGVTANGEKLLKRIEEIALERYSNDLKTLTDADVLHFAYLLTVYVGASSLTSSVVLPPLGILLTVEYQPSDALLEMLRRCQVEFISLLKFDQYPIGPSLYNSNNDVVTLRESDSIIGAFEISRLTMNELQLENAFLIEKAGSGLLQQAIEAYRVIKGIKAPIRRESLLKKL